MQSADSTIVLDGTFNILIEVYLLEHLWSLYLTRKQHPLRFIGQTCKLCDNFI